MGWRARCLAERNGTVLELITWTAIGLGAGWLARTLTRSRRQFGVVGDLTTGWLGAVVGGWVFGQLGVVAPDDVVGRVIVSLAGATTLLGGIRLLRHVTFATRIVTNAKPGPVGTTIEDRIKQLDDLERRVLGGLLSRKLSVHDPNQAFEAQTTFGERVADQVARFGGSWTFIGLFFIGMIGWMAINQRSGRPFDPYPYILLNLVLSCLASLQAPVIMMSQNRQSAKDRLDAKNDYEVNVRAELEIMALHAKLDALRDQEWRRLAALVEEQQAALAQIQQRLGARGGPSVT
jgi:uncharacterized membrane protein/uncharacterized membrane protein YeaQ/YmgE (transglycosylase-associated protein family)